MLRRLLVGVLALLAFGALPANAQRGNVEVTLGEETALKIIPDIDRIDATKVRGRYRGIRVYVLDNSSVSIAKIEIKYSNGDVFTEDRGRMIELSPKDYRTRIIGPDNGSGRERFIDQIILYYKTTPGAAQRARVRVVGVTTPAGARAVRDGGGSGAIAAPAVPSTTGSNRPGTVTAGGDVLFGVQYVGFQVDRDAIKVGSQFGKFDKIRLRVRDNDLFLNEMRVVYANGEPDILSVGINIPANSRSKWFDLKGDLFIKEIQLVYKSRPGFRGQARVEVYGEYAEGWYGPTLTAATPGQPIAPTGEAFKYDGNRGWLYLGGQQPLFFSVKKGLGYENDTVSVARNAGFNRLRLDVKDRAITLNKLTIVYGDGTSDVIPVGSKVDGGSSYGPLNLKPKAVKEIQVSYRSRLLDSKATGKGYAFVEFWVQ
jgi:hypothetical protein